MAYFPQGQAEFNFLRHMILMYGNAGTPWQQADIRPYVAHLDRQGTPDDWLFDTFLLLNIAASSGRHYAADINTGTTMSGEGDYRAQCSPTPAMRSDWDELLDFYVGPQGALLSLDRAIESCSKRIASPYGATRNVVLMLPYPHPTQQAFGRLEWRCAAGFFYTDTEPGARQRCTSGGPPLDDGGDFSPVPKTVVAACPSAWHLLDVRDRLPQLGCR